MAEANTSQVTGSVSPPQTPSSKPAKPVYKSWRKKYFKMRHQFHDLMGQNQKCFDSEQKTIRLARRLQEQNDQLLQLIYEANQFKKLDSQSRYGIKQSYLSSLLDVSSLVDEGEENDLLDLPSNPAKSLEALEATPHSSKLEIPENKSKEDYELDAYDDCIGYLSPDHEADYLSVLDNFTSKRRSSTAEGEFSTPNGPWSHHNSAVAALKNPVSVYNWLKKHQPNVFLNEGEEKEKPGVSTPVSASTAQKEEKLLPRVPPTKVQPKRGSIGTKQQSGAQGADEDEYHNATSTYDASTVGSIRGKRKQIEDEAYRPKGSSSRKKKKTSIGQSASSNLNQDRNGQADELRLQSEQQ